MALIFDSCLLEALCVASALLIAFYAYMTRNHSYWEKRGVRSVPPTILFGSITEILLLRESPGCWLRRKYAEMSGEPFFGVYLIDRPSLVVRDLDVVKRVLVKDAHIFLDRTFSPREDMDPLMARHLFGLKGRRWRHMRMKLSATFTSGKMKKMFYLMDECGKDLVTHLDQNARSGAPVNVKESMARFCTDAISTCAFGVNGNALSDPNSKLREVLRRVFERATLLQRVTSSLLFLIPSYLHLLRLRVIDEDIAPFVRGLFWDVVQQRKSTGLVRNDFVDMLIRLMDEGEVRADDARDLEELKQHSLYHDAANTKKDNLDIKLEDDDFVAQAFVFFIAGFEPSSAVLNFTMYEMALNPHIQDRLAAEIASVLDQHGGRLTYDALAEMTYLEMVVSETLRKYPTLSFLDRVCLADYKIPGSDLTVQKGTTVLIPVYGIQTDPDFYPDPEKYDPERFSAENKCKSSHFSYFPFGEGPRICIGMRFGQMQVKTALVYILKSFQVRPCSTTPKEPLHYKPSGLTHACLEDIFLSFTRRG